MLNFRAKEIKCFGLLKTKWKFFLYVLQLGKREEFLLLVLYKCTSQHRHFFFQLGSLMRSHKLTNRQQFSMVCTIIDHRNDIWIFETQVEPRTTVELLQCKVLNILTSFLWSIRVLTMENCCELFFTIRLTVLTSISVEVFRKIARTNCSTITSFPWSLLSYQQWLSTN